jgi:hypothetical protein
MPVPVIHFLFSLANIFSLPVSAVLASIWFVALGFYIREKLAARRQAANHRRMFVEYERDLVEKAPAHI